MAATGSSVRNYVLATGAVAVVAVLLLLAQPHANLTTVALAFVLVVTVAAVRWGSGPALLSALWTSLCFDYFFIPPLHTWSIGSPADWIAFAVFFSTALIVGQLSSRAQRKAEEAKSRRLEVESLYEQLKKAFEEASAAEGLRRSEQLKTALLDAVTHDLRTPLTSIKAAVTTLLGAPSSASTQLSAEGQAELLDVINEESDRLNRFVEEMMELAQLESGHFPLRAEPVSAQEIVNAALDRAQALTQRHKLEITIDDKLPLLRVDAASIANLIFELLENAAKFSPPGSRIRVTAHAGANGEAAFSVQDEGAGIPEKHREHVFEKFYRAAAPGRDVAGFGMGLAIARGIVEAHRGRIWVEPALRATGTAISFTLPCGAA